jgi:hypothetical protein
MTTSPMDSSPLEFRPYALIGTFQLVEVLPRTGLNSAQYLEMLLILCLGVTAVRGRQLPPSLASNL